MKNLLLLLLVFLQSEIGLSMSINGPLVRAGLENQASDPSTTLTGRVYWNTTNAKARIWDGSAWQDFGSGGGASAAYTITPTAVTAVGGAFSPLGHVLDTNDFGAFSSTQYSFFNLSANATDGNTTNAKNLTVGTAPTYAQTGILGGSTAASFNGTTQYLGSDDSFYKTVNGKYLLIGGWYYHSAWTSASTRPLFSIGDNSTDHVMALWLDPSTNTLWFRAEPSAGGTWTVSVDTGLSFTAATWQRIEFLYDGSTAKILVGGRTRFSTPLTGLRNATTTGLRIGNWNSTFWDGRVEEFVAVIGTTVPVNDDALKLAARRFDHNLAIGSESQLWLGTWQRSDQAVAVNLDGFLVSKDTNHAWLDFSGAATGAYVAAKMLNTQSSLTSVPQGSYDSGYLSSTPITTIPHGLGDVPAMIVVYYETSTNKFTPLTGSNFCESDATNLYCDWTGLTVAAGSRVRIQAWATGSMSAVPAASAAQSGVVNTTAQTFAGAKTFSGTIYPGGGILGRTDGAAACAGCVGEKITGVLKTGFTLPGSYADLSTTDLTLTAGNWLVVGGYSLYHSASDAGYARVRIYNATDSTAVTQAGAGDQSSGASIWVPATIVTFVSYTSTKVLEMQGYDPNATTHVIFNQATGGLDSQNEFYAIRLF